LNKEKDLLNSNSNKIRDRKTISSKNSASKYKMIPEKEKTINPTRSSTRNK